MMLRVETGYWCFVRALARGIRWRPLELRRLRLRGRVAIPAVLGGGIAVAVGMG